MAVVTTYVCDVTGRASDNKENFISVEVNVTKHMAYGGGMGSTRVNSILKLIHIDVANKLGLIPAKKDEEPAPQVTFESQMMTLLKDYINDIIYDEVSTQISNRN